MENKVINPQFTTKCSPDVSSIGGGWVETFTARKRSLGQGKVFTPVCSSVHMGVLCMMSLPVWLPDPMFLLGVSVPGPMVLPGGLCPGSLYLYGDPLPLPRPPNQKSGMHPTGMLSYIYFKFEELDLHPPQDWNF